MSSAVYLWKTFRAQAEQDSGVSPKVFGFSPESVFAFIPECCSESARNPVRLHPGTLFGLPRNTHLRGRDVPYGFVWAFLGWKHPGLIEAADGLSTVVVLTAIS